MSKDKSSFEKDYKEALALIEENSPYGLRPIGEKKYMTVPEMGRLLGLRKTDRYWLLHKNFFEWENISGAFRIHVDSFEKWYANQVKYKKVKGEPPGKELKEWSYSPKEISKLLGIDQSGVYELLKTNKIETVLVDYCKRVPKEAFYKWYNSQTHYRTSEDRKRDASIENASISIPEMARSLGLNNSQMHSLLKSEKYGDMFKIVMVADKKRVTRKSFEKFLKSQNKYKLVEDSGYHKTKKGRPRAVYGEAEYITAQEAAMIAKVSRPTIYTWMAKGYISVVSIRDTVRIPRWEFEQFLNNKDKEEK